MELNGLGKFAAIVIVLIIGLDLQGRWTGESMQWDVLGPNALGTSIRTAAYTPDASATGAAAAGAQFAAYRAGAGAGAASTANTPPATTPGWQPAPTAQVA